MSDWNGLPDQPERKGWHWVASKLKPNGWLLQKWVPECRKWNGLFGTAPAIAANLWVYGCPALNPSELAQMRKDERKRAAKASQAISDLYYELSDAAEDDADVIAFDERMVAAGECASVIRALTDDEGKKS